MLPIKNKKKDKVVITSQREIEKQLKKVGKIIPHRGHTLFKYNRVTEEMSEAIFEDTVVEYNPDPRKMKANRRVMVEKDCVYVSALNKKNARRKLNLK